MAAYKADMKVIFGNFAHVDSGSRAGHLDDVLGRSERATNFDGVVGGNKAAWADLGLERGCAAAGDNINLLPQNRCDCSDLVVEVPSEGDIGHLSAEEQVVEQGVDAEGLPSVGLMTTGCGSAFASIDYPTAFHANVETEDLVEFEAMDYRSETNSDRCKPRTDQKHPEQTEQGDDVKTINRRIPLPGENHEQNIEEDGGMVYGGHEGQWNAKGFCHREQAGGKQACRR